MAETLVMEVASFLLPILLVLPVLYLILKHFEDSKSHQIPPGPYSWPIIGNLLQIGKNPLATLTQFGLKYGPLYSIKLGNQRVVVASSPAAAMEILKTQDRLLSGRFVPHVSPAKSFELNSLSLGWSFQCNEKWKYLRTVCKTQLFSGKAIESQASLREERVIQMVKHIVSMEGKPVKIRDVVLTMVFNMLSNVLVSMDLISFEQESKDGGMSEILRTLMEVAAAPNVSDLYPILGPLDLQGLRKKAMKIYDKCCAMWEEIIKERREKRRDDSSRQEDFLDALINNGSSDYQINILLLELLSAGTDTSSSTIEWTMAELIKNPKCMKIVQEELEREITDQEMVKESHLPNLPYLQACVKETLRLHPPAPFLLPHRAVESCQVMSYTIPQNTQVLVNIWAIGRDPNYWKDPLVFKPERFLESGLDFKGNDFEFLPFGAGRRICPGLPMAAKHVPLVVASMVHFFDWSLPCGMDAKDLTMDEKYGLTLLKEEPVILIPKLKLYNDQ